MWVRKVRRWDDRRLCYNMHNDEKARQWPGHPPRLASARGKIGDSKNSLSADSGKTR